MNCNDAIAYIHSLEKFGIRPGLERIRALCDYLGNPQDSLRVIHVAGTNGKGSVSNMLAGIFRQAGLNVGMYTSPYVIDFRERIQLNGRMIEHSELARCVTAVKAGIDALNAQGIEITEFEAVTAAAFLFFAQMKCDLVVLETGLGGRFDATNVIKAPFASVIMSISLDHTAILGDTIEEIAFEKCGIVKYGGVTVIYPEQERAALEVIEKACEANANELIVPDLSKLTVTSHSVISTKAVYDGFEFELPLAGEHMVKNASVAIECARKLFDFGICADDEAIRRGLLGSSMPARLEVVCRQPLTVLDAGHNEGCAKAVADYVRANLAGRRLVMLCAMMADKDYEAYLRTVAPLADVFIATSLDMSRALSAAELARCASRYCGNCNEVSLPHKALASARNIAESGDVILVCGSFYLAGELRDDLLGS